jgi:hypothetical protein
MVSEKALKSGKTRKTGAPNIRQNDGGHGSSSNGYVAYGEEYDNPVFTMSDERIQGKSSESQDGDGGIYFIAGGGSRVSPARRMTLRDDDGVGSPTTMERELPWKREDQEEASVRQNEFPAWSQNKEYLAYNSPTNTYLGGLDRNQQRIPTVIGLFKRDSVSSIPGSRRGSIQSIHYHNNRMDSPRHSIGSDGSGGPSGMADTDNVTLSSHNTPQHMSRRGSTFVAVAIPEVAEETEKDLLEAETKDEAPARKAMKAVASTAEANKIEEVENSDDENGNPTDAPVVQQDNNNPEVMNRSSSDNKSNQTHTKL